MEKSHKCTFCGGTFKYVGWKKNSHYLHRTRAYKCKCETRCFDYTWLLKQGKLPKLDSLFCDGKEDEF